MNEINCEKVLMTKMAEIDGEETELSSEQINLHLTTCENCRREFEQLQTADHLLKRQARREQDADLWAAVEKQIGEPAISQISLKPFVWLGILLVVYKLLEMLPAQDFGLVFRLVPLAFLVALFVFLRENPFKINIELELER